MWRESLQNKSLMGLKLWTSWGVSPPIFIFSGLFFTFFPRLKSNEWITLELFLGKKKNRKRPQKVGKNKIHQLFIKIIDALPDFEWMAYELFLGNKKKTGCIFFSPLRGKNKKRNSGFWMNEWPTNFSSEIKKNTVTFGEPHY